MDRIDAMKVLVAVLDEGSLAGAARKLGRSPAGVSRAVAFLEGRMGVMLVERSAGSSKPSEAGARYATACRRLLMDLEQAELVAAEPRRPPRARSQGEESGVLSFRWLSALGELATSTAHELTERLAAIMASGQAIQHWMDQPDAKLERVRASTQRIIDDAGRAAGIVASIRALAEKPDIECAMLALHGAVEVSIEVLRRDLQLKGVSTYSDLSIVPHLVTDDHTQPGSASKATARRRW